MAGEYQNGSSGAGGDGGDGDSTLELYQFFGQIGTLAKWIAYAVVVIVLFSLLVFGRSVYTDWLWFDNLGYRGIFIKVLTTRITLFVIGAVAMAVVSGASIFAASRISRGRIALPLARRPAELHGPRAGEHQRRCRCNSRCHLRCHNGGALGDFPALLECCSHLARWSRYSARTPDSTCSPYLC